MGDSNGAGAAAPSRGRRLRQQAETGGRVLSAYRAGAVPSSGMTESLPACAGRQVHHREGVLIISETTFSPEDRAVEEFLGTVRERVDQPIPREGEVAASLVEDYPASLIRDASKAALVGSKEAHVLALATAKLNEEE